MQTILNTTTVATISNCPLIQLGMEGLFHKMRLPVSCINISCKEKEFFIKLTQNPPEIALIDMPNSMSKGLQIINLLTRYFPGTRLIIWVSWNQLACLNHLISSNIKATLFKATPVETMILALETVLDGNYFLAPGIPTTKWSEKQARNRVNSISYFHN